MFVEYSVPNGVGIARPPANNASPGLVWQAMQSPARARYSPFAISDWSSARAVARPATSRSSVSVWRSPTVSSPSVRFAAASERHCQRALWDGRGVGRNGQRCQPGGDRGHIAFGQARSNDLHAVRCGCRTRTVAEGTELRADVTRPQTHEARDGYLHAGQLGTMTARASRNAMRWIAFGHQH